MPREYTAESFINNLAEGILKQCYRSDRQQTNSSVVLRKRFRDAVDSDRYGIFNNGTNSWVDDFDTSALYSLNIVMPTVRTNVSAMITARVEVDIQPRFIKDTKSQMASKVANAIVDQKDRLQWTTQLEEYIAQEQQIAPGCFVRIKHNPHLKRKHSLAQWEDVDVEMPGKATCGQCGNGDIPVTGDVEDMMACPSCGGVAVVDQMPQNATVPIPTGYAEFSTGDTETLTHPFFEFRVDDENTQGGNLEKARWFEHHYLASLDELQLEYPESVEDIKEQANTEFSYSIKWQQALKRGRTAPTDLNAESVVEQREVRDIYLTPSMYLNIEMTEDFVLKNDKGKVRFKVKKGKTFADGEFEGKSFDEAPVLCFRLVGTCLIDIYPCDFREEFCYVTFLSNPSTFWGLFLTSLTVMQDMINIVLTIQMYHIRRNAITSIVYNRANFDPESFDEDLIPTKGDIPPDIDIRQQFGIIPALQLSGEPMQMLTSIFQLKSDITLATPAMMGQAQPNEPFHAQLLQKQSSLGLLAPAEISKASAKVKWAKQQLKLVREYWTDEDTEEYLKLNTEWDERYIQAFLDSDLDNDLVIDYVEGSEIPQSLIEREIKLNKLLTDIFSLGQVAPNLIKPEVINEIFAETIQMTGLDIDIDDHEANQRLAEGRVDKMLEIIKDVPPTSDMQMNTTAAQQIVQLPDFQPLPVENFGVIIAYYSDKAIQEASQTSPNYLILACLNALIQLEQQGQSQQAQQMSALQMSAQAPMLQAAQQQQMQQQQAEAQGQQMHAQAQAQNQLQLVQAKQQMEGQRVQADQQHAAQLQSQQHAHDSTHKVMDMASEERQKSHELELAKIAAKNKAKAGGAK